jgi:hypothetical protein
LLYAHPKKILRKLKLLLFFCSTDSNRIAAAESEWRHERNHYPPNRDLGDPTQQNDLSVSAHTHGTHGQTPAGVAAGFPFPFSRRRKSEANPLICVHMLLKHQRSKQHYLLHCRNSNSLFP